ncbi:CHASE3 domain-containing protein [Spirulina subsalsa FACHB-351]|uniref:CHASE3 domain-containing protein n=1 Tax=Spirulina subsalsa FACHB-351 TaxID=234711 RepID=A0ABT3L6U3_9CYAN|nr:methyl-accepting chemotaxis protein [Spirulina subsalsa]MCW6037222.1 CHASE3 domain-containing protein [Spirulina subsalsa FACHB-351]
MQDKSHHLNLPNSLILSKKFSSFRLRNWIIVGYSVPLFLWIISAILIVVQAQVVQKNSNDLVERTQIESAIGNFGFNVQVMSRAVRGYLLDRNSISINSYRTAQSATQQEIQTLDRIMLDPQQKQTFAQIRSELTALEQINNNLISLVEQGRTPEAIERWRVDGGRSQSEAITNLLNRLKTREQEILQENARSSEQSLNLLVTIVVTVTILSVLVAVGIASWVIHTISQRMNFTANSLASSTSEIASTIEEQERTASQQAASVNQTTTTMDELGVSARQSSEQAESAASAARQALQLADGGTQAVDQTLERMHLLRAKVEAIAEQILRLSDQTTQIGSISQLVSDLANQTNMLALNAAVEAVRAGEHGRGFSVVATEIRKLADQSKQSAGKINDLVRDIQNSINSTVIVTDEGTRTVESGVQITQSTADAFAGVAQAVNNVVLSNQQISLNIKQQSVAIQQVIEAMSTINQGAKETASGISQTKLGTQQLNEAAQSLKNMV